MCNKYHIGKNHVYKIIKSTKIIENHMLKKYDSYLKITCKNNASSKNNELESKNQVTIICQTELTKINCAKIDELCVKITCKIKMNCL